MNTGLFNAAAQGDLAVSLDKKTCACTHRHDLIASLVQNINELLKPMILPGKKYALLDFPSYGNVGDSAIWLGEKVFLRSVGASVSYVSDRTSFSGTKLRRKLKDGVILLHGGGNLGDLWPPHQRFREDVIAQFPDIPIIQLPQTMHFKERANLERARRIFNRHGQLTLLVRDTRSLELARNEFRAQSYLCPDMAFMLRDLPRQGPPTKEVVWLARTDAESANPLFAHDDPGVYRTDWRTDPRTIVFRAAGVMSRLSRSENPILQSFGGSLSYAYDGLAKNRLMRGCRILSEGRVVVTDRLHGHILCLLMNIPHVLIGDKYGKIKNFYDAWTKSCDLTVWADSLMDALAAGRTLARTLDGSAGSEHANTHDDFARGSADSPSSSMISVERSKAKRPLL